MDLRDCTQTIKDALALEKQDADFVIPQHAQFIDALLKGDVSTLDPETRSCFVSYLVKYIYAQAEANGHISDGVFTHPEFGHYYKPSVDERFYRPEIAAAKKILDSFSYSAEMKRRMSLTIDNTIAALLKEPEFIERLQSWPATDLYELPEEDRNAWFDQISHDANGALCACAAEAEKIFNMPVADVGFFLTHDRDFPPFSAYQIDFEEGETLEHAKIVFQPAIAHEIDPYEFFAMLLHEKIHNLTLQLAYRHRHGMPLDPEILEDARLRALNIEYRLDNINLINSLYFFYFEEDLCYRMTAKVEKALERFSARQHSPLAYPVPEPEV